MKKEKIVGRLLLLELITFEEAKVLMDEAIVEEVKTLPSDKKDDIKDISDLLDEIRRKADEKAEKGKIQRITPPYGPFEKKINPYKQDDYPKLNPYWYEHTSLFSTTCSCNPLNGGSGVCQCILSGNAIYCSDKNE